MNKRVLPFIIYKSKFTFEQEEMEKMTILNFALTSLRLTPLKFWQYLYLIIYCYYLLTFTSIFR